MHDPFVNKNKLVVSQSVNCLLDMGVRVRVFFLSFHCTNLGFSIQMVQRENVQIFAKGQ